MKVSYFTISAFHYPNCFLDATATEEAVDKVLAEMRSHNLQELERYKKQRVVFAEKRNQRKEADEKKGRKVGGGRQWWPFSKNHKPEELVQSSGHPRGQNKK